MALAFVGGCIFDGLITRIPKDILTIGRVKCVERGTRKYCKNYGRLPKDLSELRAFLKEDAHFGKNAWGDVILFCTTNTSSVVLLTYGPEGPGAEVQQEFRRQFDVADILSTNVHGSAYDRK